MRGGENMMDHSPFSIQLKAVLRLSPEFRTGKLPAISTQLLPSDGNCCREKFNDSANLHTAVCEPIWASLCKFVMSLDCVCVCISVIIYKNMDICAYGHGCV